MTDWLIDAADLLAEPDPGPTRWLVEGLIVDRAITALVGRWKTTKTYAGLDTGISIGTGLPAFGTAAIPEPGPVVYVIEESGKAALWRRLDALCRGRGIHPDQLRGMLHVAPNARVKLDDPEWQNRLTQLGIDLKPRAFIFDPLARMKDAARDESAQTDMAVIIEYLLHLRDDTGAAALFVHHTGHQGEHMRGTSDLESAWESKLTFKKDGDTGTVTVTATHREEEDGCVVQYRLAWDAQTRTMRLRPTLLPLAERITEYLTEHGPMGAAELATGIKTRRSDVDRTLLALQGAGTTRRGPSGKLDALGRPATNKVWHLSSQAVLPVVPDTGRPGTTHPTVEGESAGRPPSLEGTTRTTGHDGPTRASLNAPEIAEPTPPLSDSQNSEAAARTRDDALREAELLALDELAAEALT